MYVNESKEHNENQKMAKASIIFGLLGFILVFVGSIIGIKLEPTFIPFSNKK